MIISLFFQKETLVVSDFKVYNRWGHLVYNNEDPANGWDGKFKNEDAPSDVYIYMITIDMPSGKLSTKKVI